ncbi:MAG TPA: DUF3311 domain-containing protein [Bacillales bacterium]|nr:DUF3311 domain-containing protein [Bacillales bacterium]
MRWLLLIIIVVGNICLLPWINKIHPIVAGFPFFLFWLFLWMVISPFLTWWIYALDKKKEQHS